MVCCFLLFFCFFLFLLFWFEVSDIKSTYKWEYNIVQERIIIIWWLMRRFYVATWRVHESSSCAPVFPFVRHQFHLFRKYFKFIIYFQYIPWIDHAQWCTKKRINLLTFIIATKWKINKYLEGNSITTINTTFDEVKIHIIILRTSNDTSGAR